MLSLCIQSQLRRLRLLYESIKEDGYTMPIVCYYVKAKDVYVFVDGFHRYTVMRTSRHR